jgi:hypothetical protein
MCSVSMVIRDWQNPQSPNSFTFTSTIPAPDVAKLMLDVIVKLEAIDKRLGAIDCKVEALEKRKFIRKLQRRAKKAK